jgi:hypothetical protein
MKRHHLDCVFHLSYLIYFSIDFLLPPENLTILQEEEEKNQVLHLHILSSRQEEIYTYIQIHV